MALGEEADFEAHKFDRITTVEPCTNVSYKDFNRHIAKPMLVVVVVFIFLLFYLRLHSISLTNFLGVKNLLFCNF